MDGFNPQKFVRRLDNKNVIAYSKDNFDREVKLAAKQELKHRQETGRMRSDAGKKKPQTGMFGNWSRF